MIATREPSAFLQKRKSISVDRVGEGRRLMGRDGATVLRVERLTMRFGGLVAVE